MGFYTQHCEDEMFLNYRFFDDVPNDDYVMLIEKVNSPDMFRTFGDGIVAFLQEINHEITLNTAKAYIKLLCDKTGVPVKKIASDGTFDNWFKKGICPKKGEDSRERIFALAFAMQLTSEKTAELFHRVYLDRAFDFRNYKEMIYYYCLENGESWNDAVRLIDLVDSLKLKCVVNEVEATKYTEEIKSDIDKIRSESDLINYIINHDNDLHLKNVTAKETLEELREETIKLVEKEIRLEKKREKKDKFKKTHLELIKQNPKLLKDYLDNIDVKEDLITYSGNNCNSSGYIYSVILYHLSETGRSNENPLKNKYLPDAIRTNFPTADALEGRDLSYEELRKAIILLGSYNYWRKCEIGYEYEFIEVDIEDYISEINAELNDCGFSPLYFGNPYDWLFMYCVVSDPVRPLNAFRAIIQTVLIDTESDED